LICTAGKKIAIGLGGLAGLGGKTIEWLLGPKEPVRWNWPPTNVPVSNDASALKVAPGNGDGVAQVIVSWTLISSVITDALAGRETASNKTAAPRDA
jgi:hypothetical protein